MYIITAHQQTEQLIRIVDYIFFEYCVVKDNKIDISNMDAKRCYSPWKVNTKSSKHSINISVYHIHIGRAVKPLVMHYLCYHIGEV